MSVIFAGSDIELMLGLLEDDTEKLGFTIYHKYGASFIGLEEFIEEAKRDLESADRQRYAGAFEIMARKLRS